MSGYFDLADKGLRENEALYFWFARHGRALTGVGPEHAQIVGSVSWILGLT